MDFGNEINRMLGQKEEKIIKKDVKESSKMFKGKFIKSYHHPTKSKRIDEETWWVPTKSGPITKGYFQDYYYDAKRKVVYDKKTGRIMEKIR